MRLDLKLNKSGIPIYLQLKEQIKLAMATGQLEAGTQLPTVRQLAVQLEINANTVSRVYSELEVEGYLLSQQGRGTFVAARKDEVIIEKVSEEYFAQLAEGFLIEAYDLGFTLSDVIQYLLKKREEVNQ